MIGRSDLFELAKGKLNITWSDVGTDARLGAILTDAIPVVSDMVGLTYDYEEDEALDESGEVFDFSAPSMERYVLLNYVAYEWNHQANLFRSAYWQDIKACRKRHALLTEESDGDSE